MTVRLQSVKCPGAATRTAKHDAAAPGPHINPAESTRRNPMVDAHSAPDAGAEVVGPADYHAAQEAYRAKYAELTRRGVGDAHAAALNAAVDEAACRLTGTGWLLGGLPGQGKGAAPRAVLVDAVLGGEAA